MSAFPQAALPIAANVIATFQEASRVSLKIPPKLSVTEWAELHFRLSSEDSAQAGRYYVSRAPYQREILDCAADPMIEEVVMELAAQTAKTMCIKIWIAYFAKEDPSPIIFVLPDIPLAKRVSRQRLAPMFRDMPLLKGLLEQGANKAGNATLEKSFPGGVLVLVGANSPAGLSSMPARILMADEINRYPESAGSEGNPIALAEERLTSYWNAKRFKASTPTDPQGAITTAREQTDMREWFVPCPHCVFLFEDSAVNRSALGPSSRETALADASPGLREQKFAEFLADPAPWLKPDFKIPEGYQVLSWRRMSLDKEPPHAGTCCACQHCGAEIAESDKIWMNARGRWIPQKPEILHRRGYRLSALNSPFVSWAKLTEKWLNAMANRHNRELLKTFINLSLAETFNDEAETLDNDELMGRREDYPCPVPDGVTVLTAAVDVQHDRLEFLVRGWGKGQESWLIDRKVFEGDTSRLVGEDLVPPDEPDAVPVKRPSPWERLDQYHERAYYLHARGVRLPIYCTFIDSGDQTTTVYGFVKTRKARWIYATKGIGGFGKPPLGNFAKNNRANVRVYLVGVDEIKRTLYRRMKIGTPGAGYLHFPREHCDTDYFKQLTCEQLKYKSVKGFRVRFWEKPAGARNEALDLEVLAFAAFLKLSDNPEKFLEAARGSLLERAMHAKAQRKGHTVDPNQLALLDAPAAATAVAAVQASAVTDPAAAHDEPDASDQEYKAALALEPKRESESPEPEPPGPNRPAARQKIRVVRGPWLR